MLLAEDLLLLLTHDVSGRLVVPAAQADAGLAGALLVELTLQDRVGLDEGGRVTVADPSPTGDAVLDGALAVAVAREGKKPKALIQPLAKGLRRALYRRLADEGAVRYDERRVLGLFPVRRWPATAGHHEAEVRARVTQVLVQRTTPDQRTAALVALLHALKAERKVVDPRRHGLSNGDLRARAKDVARGHWASAAVRASLDDMMAAVTAAVVAAAATGSSSGS